MTRLVCRGQRLDPSQVSDTTNLVDDLGFDSLDAAELLAALNLKTVSDIAHGLVTYPDREKVS